MQGLKARGAALARAVRDAAATESAAMSAQRRGFQEALFYLQASGMVGAAMSAGCAEPACSANGDLWRARLAACFAAPRFRSEEHTSELQSLMRISYAVFCLKNKNTDNFNDYNTNTSYRK